MRARRERGQATVEFALILPLVLVALAGVLQVGMVVYSHLAVTHLAREAARTLAVDSSADIGHLMDENLSLGTEGLVVEVQFEPSSVEGRTVVSVRISYETPAIVDLFAPFSQFFTVHHEVRMLTES